MKMISQVLQEQYGEKVYRLALTSGCTCPNRDGTLGYGGCTFCSEGGSGEFAAPLLPVGDQIAAAKARIAGKTKARKFIAYFQSFTNTYGDVDRLRTLYKEAIAYPEIVALSLGTRPDCLGEEVMDMLTELNAVKPVWIELGLQTIHEETARRIRRGYSLPVFEDACRRLKQAGITVIVHVILNLPGETKEDMLATIRYLSEMPDRPDGIKLQMLQILRGTEMAKQYEREPFPLMTLEEYAALLKEIEAILPEDMVVHRLTGDGPKSLLIAPLWCADKKRVLNTLRR